MIFKNVSNHLVPTCLVDTRYQVGGYRELKTKAELDNLPTGVRRCGMLVYVIEEDETYRLNAQNEFVKTTNTPLVVNHNYVDDFRGNFGEIETNKRWIDGRPIYRRVKQYSWENKITLNDNVAYEYSIGALADNIVKTNIVIHGRYNDDRVWISNVPSFNLGDNNASVSAVIKLNSNKTESICEIKSTAKINIIKITITVEYIKQNELQYIKGYKVLKLISPLKFYLYYSEIQNMTKIDPDPNPEEGVKTRILTKWRYDSPYGGGGYYPKKVKFTNINKENKTFDIIYPITTETYRQKLNANNEWVNDKWLRSGAEFTYTKTYSYENIDESIITAETPPETAPSYWFMDGSSYSYMKLDYNLNAIVDVSPGQIEIPI